MNQHPFKVCEQNNPGSSRECCYWEKLSLQLLSEFSEIERWKVLDLLHRFSIAKKYNGIIKFDLQWLREAEKHYDPLVDPRTNVLKYLKD